MVHWRRKWQLTPIFLPEEPYEQYEKSKRYDNTEKSTPQVRRCPIFYLEVQRATANSSIKKKAAGPKWKQCSVVEPDLEQLNGSKLGKEYATRLYTATLLI